MTAANSNHANGNGNGTTPTKRRNLVMFMPDQLRYDSLGATGNPVLRTPNIDAFAKKGTLFTNCFTQASVCTQSRCSMFTGQYLHTSAHRSLDYLLQAHEDNMFKTLKENGYHVAYLGPRGDTFAVGVTESSVHEYGWVESPPNYKVMPYAGLKEIVEVEDAPLDARTFFRGKLTDDQAMDYDKAVIDSAIEWLNSDPPQPFCLFMPLLYPHPPFQVADPYWSMYGDQELPPRIRLEDTSGHEPSYRQNIRDEHGLERATEEHWKAIKATYYGMITRLDDQFGSVIEAIRSRRLWDDTYTMFFTDHGEYLGDFGMIEKWPSGLSEQLVHEPLIIVGPDLPAGQVNSALCEMVDLVPTVFELLGIAEHYPHSGLSLVPVIKSNKSEHKPYAFSEGGFLIKEEPFLEYAGFPYDKKAGLQHRKTEIVGRAIACRDKSFTYIYRLYESHELYDRINDPQETDNLIQDPAYAAHVLKYNSVILRWMVETSDYVPWRMDPRFPQVDLESTKSQLERRKMFNH